MTPVGFSNECRILLRISASLDLDTLQKEKVLHGHYKHDKVFGFQIFP